MSLGLAIFLFFIYVVPMILVYAYIWRDTRTKRTTNRSGPENLGWSDIGFVFIPFINIIMACVAIGEIVDFEKLGNRVARIFFGHFKS